MSKKVFFFGTLALLIIMASISLAYGSNSEKDVIGKWKAVKMAGPEDAGLAHGEIEFFSDKTYMSTFDDPGQWTILDDGRIKIKNPVKVMLATIKENQMIIDFPKSWGNRVLVLEKKVAIEEAQYKTAIIGTWQTMSGNMTIEQTFNKDMSHILKINIPGRDTEMSDKNTQYYKFIDKNIIETGGGIIYTINKISKNELTFYREDIHKYSTYKRISK